jgi:hypothetical protein
MVDEVDAAGVDPREFGVIDDLGIDVKPPGIVARDGVPEFDEAHHLGRLIGAGQVGVGIAQAAALLLEGEEGLDAGAGRAAQRQVVAIEPGRVAPVGDGMEIEREGVGSGEHHGAQGWHPSAEQGELVLAGGPVRVVGGERLLGQDVQPGEEAQGLVEVEVVDVAVPLLVPQLQGQQCQERGGRRDHLRAGIGRVDDQSVEPELSQQGQEQEDPGHAGPQTSSRAQVQEPLIGDSGLLGTGEVFAARSAWGPSAAIGDEKGGMLSCRT